MRDDILPHYGVRLEDRGKGQDAIWKYADKEELLKEIEQKAQDKLKKEEEKKRKAELDLKKKSTAGKDWFKVFFADKYSQFNDEGLPTHDEKGKELSESIRNKLKKDQNKQEQTYQKWITE